MLGLVVSLFSLGLPQLAQADDAAWLTLTGDLRGEIKPCGCSADGDMGGLLRRTTYLEQRRQSHDDVLYFDLGNNFPKPSEQGNLKVDLIQKSMHVLKPEGILVGPNELLYDRTQMDLSLPYFLSNLKSDWSIKTQLTSTVDGKTVGTWGYLSPTQIYQNKNEALAITPVDQTLLTDWKSQVEKAGNDLSVLLFRGNEQELEQFHQANIFDLIITGSNNDDELHQVLEMKTASAVFTSIPTKGQGAMEGAISFADKKVPLKVEWLYGSYEDHPEVKPFFQAYDDKVKELFFSNLDRMDEHALNTPYAGAETCQTCHVAQFKTWSNSRHSHAFETLKKEEKHFDLECLACHVVGLNQGGFLSPELTPKLPNVQCENCHGPSKAHVSNPVAVKPPNVPANQACASCHVGSHSPKFKFADYWPKIQH